MLNKYKKLPIQIKASLWFLICSFLQKGVAFITTPIFTRLLTTEEYGRFNVFNSWEGIVTVFITLNLFYGVYTQGLIKFEKEKNIFSSSLQGLTLTLVSIFFVIYIFLKKYINNIFNLTDLQMILMFIIIWTSAVFQFWAAEKRVEYKYKDLVIITVISSLLNPLVGILLIKIMNNNVLARILGIAIVYLIFYGWMFFYQLKKGGTFYSRKYWIYALKFNIPLIPHYLSQTVLNISDRIMIDKMVSSSKSGIYSLAYSISMIMILFNNALAQTISPWLYQKIKNNKIKEIAPVAYASLIFIAFVNYLLMLVAPEAVAFFAPKEYYDAIWVIPPVAMSVYFMFAYDLFAKFEFYFEKTKSIAVATTIGAITNVVLNCIFIKKFGYIAAGYTTLVCYILYALFHYLFMRRVCKKECGDIQPYDTKKIFLISIIFILLGFSTLFLYKYIILRYTILFIIAIMIIIKHSDIIAIIKRLFNLKKES